MVDEKISDFAARTADQVAATDIFEIVDPGLDNYKITAPELAGMAFRTTFSNADYPMVATDRYVGQTGTMSAPRTVTLPLAIDVPAGAEVTIVDESGTVTPTNYLLVATGGGDTLHETLVADTTTDCKLMEPYSSIKFTSNGTDKWVATGGTSRHAGYLFFFGTDAESMPLAVPNNVWTPVPWGISSVDPYGFHDDYTASTTIAVGESDVLPTATISLTDATNFTTSGFVLVNGPPGADVYTIIGYTGKSGNNLTGCNSGANAGIATGTLAAGQVVTQAEVIVFDKDLGLAGGWGFMYADVAWAANGTGNRGIRFRSFDGVFNFPAAANHAPGLNISQQHQQVVLGGPGSATGISTAGIGLRVEVWQTSGGVVNIVSDGIQAPQFMLFPTVGNQG